MTKQTQATDMLARVGDTANCFCALCGRLYTARPILCLCRSNCFLNDVEPETVTPDLMAMSEQRTAQWSR